MLPNHEVDVSLSDAIAGVADLNLRRRTAWLNSMLIPR
jgi:hypothetical protein